MAIELYRHQIEALPKMHNGCILVGGVGSGKSRTSLAYYYIHVCHGLMKINGVGHFKKKADPRDLYIITTAKKRDSKEWEEELSWFDVSDVNVTVDSWNNIKKYKDVFGAFFIFDEQRLVGRGAWVKTFWNIARKNQWILLSATPGDTWSDYVPVFIANGYFKNVTEFRKRHCVFNQFAKFPKIERYVDQGALIKYRNDILVDMEFERQTEPVHLVVSTEYDKQLYKQVWRDRWDPYDNEPISETGKLCYLLRRVVNSDASRLNAVLDIFKQHPRVIVFYNFTYELNALRGLLNDICRPYGEWNGEVHSEVPIGDEWAYLVQYSAGAEGWNCITTDTMIFYSQNYSYRMTVQAEGRIDRLNTPFKKLYYYKLMSNAPIDIAIARALRNKKSFNERRFLS